MSKYCRKKSLSAGVRIKVFVYGKSGLHYFQGRTRDNQVQNFFI